MSLAGVGDFRVLGLEQQEPGGRAAAAADHQHAGGDGDQKHRQLLLGRRGVGALGDFAFGDLSLVLRRGVGLGHGATRRSSL